MCCKNTRSGKTAQSPLHHMNLTHFHGLQSSRQDSSLKWQIPDLHLARLGKSAKKTYFCVKKCVAYEKHHHLSVIRKLQALYCAPQYNNHGLPTLWMPPKGITPVNVTYDRYGHPATWERGPNHETITYDDEGRATSRTTADGATWTFLNQGEVSAVIIFQSMFCYGLF